MKKRLFVVLVILVLVVGSVGVYGFGPKKSEAAPSEPAKDTVALSDAHVPEGSVGSFVAKPNCDGGTTTDCYKIEAKKVVYITDNNKKISGKKLDEVEGFWQGKVTVDEHGNLYDKEGNLYSSNGLVKIESGNIPKSNGESLVVGKVTQVKGLTVIPLKNEQVKVGEATVPESIYKKYGTMIDPAGEHTGSKLILQNDGLVEVTTNQNTKITTTKVEVKDSQGNVIQENSGETYTTLEGTCKGGCSTKEGWSLTENKLTKEGITIYVNSPTSIIELEGDEKTIYIKTGEGMTTDKFKDNNLISSETKFNDGTTFEAEEIENNEIKEGRYYTKEGRLFAVCYETDCQGKPDNSNNIWVENDYFCQGTKNQCVDSKTGKLKTEQKRSEDSCEEGQCEAVNSKEWEGFWRGETTTQKTIGTILNIRPGWEALSTWWMPETTKKWQKWASETFDKILLAEYVVPAAICDYDEKHKVKKPGESAVFIEIAPGITQHVGSIQAEKTPKAGPALCSEEMPCQIGECQEGICYKDEKVVEAIFYKITWGVTSPSDESFTPYLDENMIAVKYNIQLRSGAETVWLYPADSAGNERTLQLENGESDRDTYLTYSPNDYSEACVIFGAPPKDLKGDEVKEFCADFVVSTEGEIEWKDSGKRGSEGTVKVNDLGRKQI